MGSSRTYSRLRALIATGALAVALAVPIGVSADTTGGGIAPAGSDGATVAVSDTVHVTSKVIATVDVSFTCDPFQVYDWDTGGYVTTTAGFGEVNVTVVQASGRSVASASASGGSGRIVCDGSTTHALSVPVVASTLPWKNGAAVVGVTVYAYDDQGQTAHGASTGPIAVKLGK